MYGTKINVLPLALYCCPSFPDGTEYSIKPLLACQNFWTRAGTRLYVFICPKLQGMCQSLQTAPFHSPVHSISITEEGNVCWLAGQQTDRYKMPPHSSFQASAIYRRESLVVPSFDFVESGKSFTLGKYFL